MIDHIGPLYGTVSPGRPSCQTGADTILGGKTCLFMQAQDMTSAPERTIQHILFTGGGVFYDIGIYAIDREGVACFEDTVSGDKGSLGGV